MRVADVMTIEVATVDVSERLARAAGLMRERNVGSLVVMERGRIAGILTDRQVALAIPEDGHVTATVGEVMTAPVRVIPATGSVFELVEAMRSAGFPRRLPVVDPEGELIGIVSVSDIALAAKRLSNAVLDEAAHVALGEVMGDTGARRFAKELNIRTEGAVRRPSGPVTGAGGT